MKNIEKQYLTVLKKLLKAPFKGDRTGTGTYSLFGVQLRHNFKDGFPLLTTKKVHFPSIAHELLWFIRGDTNVGYLQANGVTIWDEWADYEGELGRIYGVQWRRYRKYSAKQGCLNHYEPYEFDQLANVIESIKQNPDSRRHIVDAWNVGELDQMALPPCHYAFQFYVLGNKLSICVSMRSCDFFLGCPYNIASYALLNMLVAQQCGLGLGELVLNIGDCHLYANHVEQAKLQLSREPFAFPQMVIDRKDSIDDYIFEDFHLLNYQSHKSIKAPIAV
jgi:thymidylate synthase